jgi:tetratricopeptide (TPR) repeat protein
MSARTVLENLALLVLIVVVALRPLIAESYDSTESSITRALGDFSDPSPLRTLVFDVLILAGGVAWLLGRAIGRPRRYRWTGLEIGTALLLVACVISSVGAGNKRIAINGAIDWVCYPILAIVLTQLLQRAWQRHLFLVAILATACAQAVECFAQYFYGYEDTWQRYVEMKEEFWARQGIPLDSSKVELFERRAKAREAQGFLSHSNITGSYLVLCGFAALGVAFNRRKAWASAAKAAHGEQSRPPPWSGGLLTVCAFLGAALILGATLVTGSLGAVAAGVVGLICWCGFRLFRGWVRAHHRAALGLGWLAALAIMLCAVAYGLRTGSLPQASLDFRWKYWQASAAMVRDHFWTGVGRENFGRHYTAYKSIESPEEVANPHNLFVQATADWGVLGLAALVAMLVGGSIALTRPSPRRDKSLMDTSGRSPPKIVWLLGLIVFLGVILPRIGLLGTDDADFIYYTTLVVGFVWAVGFAVFAPSVPGEQDADSGSSPLAAGIAVGLLAFLVHDLINFALFVPATATTFFALVGLVLAHKSSAPVEERITKETRKNGRVAIFPARWAGFVVGSAVLLALCFLFVAPVAKARKHVQAASAYARRLARVPLIEQPANREFLAAAEADQLDPAPLIRQAEWLAAASTTGMFDRNEGLRLAVDAVDLAIDRDRFNMRLYRMKARLLLDKAAESQSAEDFRRAIAAAEQALTLYPESPQTLVLVGDCRLAAGAALGDSESLERAITRFKEALTLDDQRPDWEVIRRLRPWEVEQIRGKIQQAALLMRRSGEERE